MNSVVRKRKRKTLNGTYPSFEMTSLVILTFLTHPWQSSSSVHSSFFSIGWAFLRAVVCEKIIGVLLLMILDKETGGSSGEGGVVGVSGPPELLE